ncbi:hypothetical protein CHH28_03345 [Bacterioplanes sanyensis]|uniref:Iron-binding zinc finger CDGSH type domain-containing protein n=1 Tax=Bacterioplanes sanyensis TaxID=1249553 RepID=A0A222FGQ2_9GAMM|nr:CDGSH iron-sulfur domain-containing protein [Bacterioplanes sanyensis]ASP37766.1 hypothetical protein CHH28_03345 [Bacterioplanes sanyensis]
MSDAIPIVHTWNAHQQQRLCGCKQCQRRPYADDSCTTPIQVLPQRQQMVWLCSCRLSQRYPYCDGSHNPRNGMTLRQAVAEICKDVIKSWRRD